MSNKLENLLDSENVITSILLFCAALFLVLGFLGYQYLEYQATQKKIEKGLEQCYKNPLEFNSDIIWIKDCKGYTETLKPLLEQKEKGE